ncbi:hypothetical protein ROJ8625_02310 [Roseivivax jejudonensis]|uniref:Uncharacterized protein n=1 Tax=Roseivivax jejudonensis TaxID=1529041 RepID=A0A1X6ZD22_9RHOB|nr:hypothetical protein [Roseivivax jejudonensis]SLN47401.1 hypothetical protein ROJ8625_02310 [Roseivivax jejudonensis]
MTQDRSRIRRMIEAGVPRKALRDLGNLVRYGRGRPLSDECIWIDPRLASERYSRPETGPAYRRRHSGVVADGDWDLSRAPIESGVKIRACRSHFVDGLSWEDTGIVEVMMRRIERHGIFDGCRSRDDVLARYQDIDRMFDEVSRNRRIDPVSKRAERFRREHGGVLVHIDRNGLPMLAGNGNHRMAIARILGLERIPAQLGALHRTAFDNGILQELRRPN